MWLKHEICGIEFQCNIPGNVHQFAWKKQSAQSKESKDRGRNGSVSKKIFWTTNHGLSTICFGLLKKPQILNYM